MASKPKYKMTVQDRAKQFMPFAALKGYDEALRAKEKIVVDKVTLSPEKLDEIDTTMHQIKIGMVISVIYYFENQYIKKTGMVAKIDATSRFIQIVDTKIYFDDIYDVIIN
ncbi:MAG: YolD-like family protein [Lachnospiraceae bacterium]|nr:YolD-like family protein [Lachnospiraceae bacterium]